jgi:hypothetical protein
VLDPRHYTHSGRIRRLLIFELWHRNYLERVGLGRGQRVLWGITNCRDPGMSPPGDIGSIPHVSTLGRETLSSPMLRDPVFLMVNSLETGGMERQFVKMGRALQNDRIPVQLGCFASRCGRPNGHRNLCRSDKWGIRGKARNRLWWQRTPTSWLGRPLFLNEEKFE